METFGEKIITEACSWSGECELTEEDENDDTKIVKSGVSGFSRGKLRQVGTSWAYVYTAIKTSLKVVVRVF